MVTTDRIRLLGGRRGRLVLAVLPAAVLSLGAGAQVSSAAAPPEERSVSNPAPAVTAAAEEAGRKAKGRKPTAEEALSAYWTADTMQKARPVDEAPGHSEDKAAHKTKADRDAAKAKDDEAKGVKPEPTGPVGKTEPQAADAASPTAGSPAVPPAKEATSSAGAPNYPYWAFAARTAGKVFFTNTSNGLNYVCSGTVVNSEGKSSVWTAGHCVHGGRGRTWHANWVFVPSYANGSAPYGRWTARQLWTTSGWAGGSEWAGDMGVSIMNTLAGWRIASYLGGQGITWNQSKRLGVTDFGYPAATPFNGQTLFTCGDTTFPEWEFTFWSAETLGLSCNMTGGSSGGGWLAFFNGSVGYLNGNNSFKYTNDPSRIYSPYYDGTASSLYASTRGL